MSEKINRFPVVGLVSLSLGLGACGSDEPPAAVLAPATDLTAPRYVAGAAEASATFPDRQLRGTSTVDFADDQPRVCATEPMGAGLRFLLRVGPETIRSGRSDDRVRLRTGRIGRRSGQAGLEAPIVRQVIEIGGAGLLAPGAAGVLRLAADLRSGVATVGTGDARVTVSFTC